MKIFFLGGLFPSDRKIEIAKNSISAVQNAANNLQWALIKGLDHYFEECKIISLPFVASYPFGYKQRKISSSQFSHKISSIDYCIGFYNYPIINLFSRYINARKALIKCISNNYHSDYLIIYAVHTPFLKAAVDIKKYNPNLKICLIVPDLPQFMTENKFPIYKLLKKIDYYYISQIIKKIDSFVLLTDSMALSLKISNKPWVRVEGIYEQTENNDFVSKEEYKTILYTGTLEIRSGIINLLDAFTKIKNPNYRLWICGEGKGRTEIEKRAKVDCRIKYYGQLIRSDILTLQKKATVLINPRNSTGDYTKYSFPSKLMEYMASGTPCIIYRLEGIPEEYFEYCFVINSDTIEELKNTIIEVCEMSQSELNIFGSRASHFIQTNKNPKIQVKKIFTMINQMP